MTGPEQHPSIDGGSGVVVAVDGTSGSGKSSTSRGVAARLRLRYLDTGAMYRAVTWWMLEHGVDVHDADAVASRAAKPRLASGTDPTAPTITVDDQDVATVIRTAVVNAAVSPVSAVPQVRRELLALQRAVIEAAVADGVGIVVEGRDIGSVVWPQAPVKIYLSADDGARAERRAAEEGGSDLAMTRDSLLARDRIDSGRTASPLVRADGAIAIDTTSYTLDDVVEQVVTLVSAAISTAGSNAGSAAGSAGGSTAGSATAGAEA